jgi:hypothetical protein
VGYLHPLLYESKGKDLRENNLKKIQILNNISNIMYFDDLLMNPKNVLFHPQELKINQMLIIIRENELKIQEKDIYHGLLEKNKLERLLYNELCI